MARKQKGKKSDRSPAAAPGRPTEPAPAAPAPLQFDRRYWIAAGGIFVFATVLRLVWLGAPAFQHDEAIYSVFALNFHTYNFDPTYHGPLLYYLLHVTFMALGDTDFTARLVSVVLGLLTLGMVVGPARRWLGPRASLWSLTLLAVSPAMVAYHRRIFHDSLVHVLTLGAILAFHSTQSAPEKSWRWRGGWITLASVMTLFLATKANAFFLLAVLGSYWVALRLRPVAHRALGVRMPAYVPMAAFILVSLFAAAAGERDKTKAFEVDEIILTVVIVGASVLVWEWLRRPPLAPRSNKKVPPPLPHIWLWQRPDRTAVVRSASIALVLSAVAAAFLFAFLFGHGHLWWQNPIETIPRYWQDIKNAIPRTLEYWGGQQKTPRLPGRHDYYLPLMILYELPVLLAAIAGVVRVARERSPFMDLVLWWAFTSYSLYALANEKVPWLSTHILLPFCLLGGHAVAQAWPWRRQERKRAWAVAAVSAVLLLRNVSATNYERAVDHKEPMFYAFTSEAFGDAFLHVLDSTRHRTGDMWIFNAWPTSWYLRNAGKDFPGAVVHYPETLTVTSPLRMVVSSESEWNAKKDRFVGWHRWTWDEGRGLVSDGTGENPHILNWPRASWQSLRPDRLVRWWIFREASIENGFLTEWSHIPAVVATPP